MKPLITVIIDTFNYEAYIEYAINSVLSQTLPKELREIIVVDDGSTDNTAQRVAAYGNKILYHRKENGGQASAFNAGISLAQGDYISFLDADDYFYPAKLSRVLNVFERDNNIGIVFNKYDIINENGRIIQKNMPNHFIAGDIKSRVLMGYKSGSPTSGISIKKQLAQKVSIPEPPFKISADYFYLNIIPLMCKVGIVESSEHAYRIHHSNLYMQRAGSERAKVHAMQDYVIWDIADKMGLSFFKGLHALDHSPQAENVRGRIMILARGILWLIRADGAYRLKMRSFVKLIARFILPEQVYRKFQRSY